MPVYFVRELRDGHIKIGVSQEIRRRLSQLQTGSPCELALMGWLESQDDFGLERDLHREYSAKRLRGEWFSINQDDVLKQLVRHQGFIPKNDNSFEVIGYDRDGIPEYMGICTWADFEIYECCPFCGCFCGMHFQETSGMYHCVNCDTLTDFSDLRPRRGEF